MKIKPLHIVIISALAAVIAAVLIAFYVRSPVLIVTEESFLNLYSEYRAEQEIVKTSFALFRQVKIVKVANDAGYDIVPVAVMDTSSRPYCVIFPLRFVRSAKLFSEQNPDITVIILEGRYQDTEKPTQSVIGDDISGFFIYKTDVNSDFYKAGTVAAVLDQEKSGSVVVFSDKNMPQARESFLRGLNDRGNLLETRFFTSFLQYSEISNLSVIVLAGSGSEIVEKKTGIPIILFTWIDPSLLPLNAALVIDDSSWVQARDAVKMASKGEKQGFIESKFYIIDRKNLNKRLLRL